MAYWSSSLLPMVVKGNPMLIVFTSVLLFIWIVWPKCQQWFLARKIPGPPGYPVVGSGLLLQGDRAHTFRVLNRLFARYGSVFKTWSILNLTVFLRDPDDIRAVFGNRTLTDRSRYIMEALVFFIGGGLMTVRGEKWRRHRKALGPMFQARALEAAVGVFADRAQGLCDNLAGVADGRTLDFGSYITLLTLDTICSTVVGFKEKFPGGEQGARRFYDAVMRCEQLVHARIFYPWILSPSMGVFHSGREIINLKQELHALMDGIYASEFRARSRQPSSERQACEDDERGSPKKVGSLVDMLVKVMEDEGAFVMGPQRIRDEILGMLLAGLETTAISISFLLIMLGIHKDVQEAVIRELDEVFGDDTRPTTAEDLIRLETLDRAMKESLRLFPTAPFLPRDIPEDLKLPSGYVLPAGSNALVYTYQVHRDERYFPDPESFNPDRWLPENRSRIHPYAYLPFGAGVRNCIGYRYALSQIKTVSSMLLRRYRVTTPYSMGDLDKVVVGITLKLESKFLVQFHERRPNNN